MRIKEKFIENSILCGLTAISFSTSEASDLSIAQQLNQKTSIFTKKGASLREAPGVVSVITRQEILNTGARDLLDALTLLVPGFGFGNDVEGVVGANYRGMWVHEGKFLLQIDNVEMNERVFGVANFGNKTNLDDVDRIEIIRGPGSAMYGGYAETAVINVITRGVKQNQIFASGTNSQMSKSFTHRGGTLGFGKEFGNFGATATLTAMPGNRSQVPFDLVDPNDSVTPIADTSTLNQSKLNVTHITAALNYKTLQYRYLTNRYQTISRQSGLADPNVGPPYYQPVPENFITTAHELKHEWGALPSLKILTKVGYKADTSWQLTTPESYKYYDRTATQTKADLTAVWEISDAVSLETGLKYGKNGVKLNNPAADSFQHISEPFSFTNNAFYAQGAIKTDLLNINWGARYDWSNAFSSAFLPKFSITKAFDQFHYKLAAGKSFRVPVGVLPDLAYPAGTALKPETAMTYEAQFGYLFTENLYWDVNFFDISINKPIVYQYIDPNDLVNNTNPTDTYTNMGYAGTRGVESQFKWKTSTFQLQANYSFYGVSKAGVDTYKVPGKDSVNAGAAAHKLNIYGTYEVLPQVYLTPSLSYLSERPYLNPNQEAKRLPPVAYLNFNLRLEDLFMKGLQASLGVRDLTDRGTYFPPGYFNGFNPLPGASRSFFTQLSYSIQI